MTFRHPEVVFSGLDIDLAQTLLNASGRTVAKELVREPNQHYDDVPDGYPYLFKRVPVSAYETYFGRTLVFYQAAAFPMLPCLWLDAPKRFPGYVGYGPVNQEALFEQ